MLFFRELGLPLAERAKRVEAMVRAGAAALEAEGTGTTMDGVKMFEAFDPAVYEDEVRQRWGETEAYRESKRRTKRYTAEDWEKVKAEVERWFYPCPRAMHQGLGEFIVNDARFARNLDRVRAGLARYARDAFRANAERNPGTTVQGRGRSVPGLLEPPSKHH